jgi:hypothetical protein
MNQRSTSVAVSGLRWVLVLVILLESVHFALAPAAAREVANIGLPEASWFTEWQPAFA